jgi:hypothetical protein
VSVLVSASLTVLLGEMSGVCFSTKSRLPLRIWKDGQRMLVVHIYGIQKPAVRGRNPELSLGNMF